MKRKTLYILLITIFTFILISPVFILFICKLKNSTEIGIPKIYLKGNLDNFIDKRESRKLEFEYVDNDTSFEAYAKLKLQGSSGIYFNKKNYNIKLYKDDDLDEKLDYDFGWGKYNKYCLKSNIFDKTYSRNIVTSKLIAEVNKKYNLFTNTPNYGAVDGKPVEIYLNNEFFGLYTLNIAKDAWMFNLDEEDENNILLISENTAPGNLFTGEADFVSWDVEVGDKNYKTLNKLNRVIDFVRLSSDEEFKKEIDNYFNLDSLLNYFILMQYASLDDNVGKNILLVTYDGKIWYTCLYDLDASWGCQWKCENVVDYKNITAPSNSLLWQRVEKIFAKELADRYFELKEDILSYDHIMEFFNNFYNSIPADLIKKDIDKWELNSLYEIKQIDDYLSIRIPILDKYFRKLYKPSIKNK